MAEEAMSRFPDRPGGYVRRGEVAMHREDWTAASERWEELRQAFPDHPSGYMRGAKALMRAGRPEEAQALAFEAMERFPEASPGGHVQRGEVLMRRGNDANTGRPLRGPPVRIERRSSGYQHMAIEMNPSGLGNSRLIERRLLFPTLDADLGDDLRNRSGTAKRICIATPDILGPVKNGGIGTAYHHVARFLAELGHDVVIAFVNGNASNARLMEEVRAFYAEFRCCLRAYPAAEN